jgi:hypothetical protein
VQLLGNAQVNSEEDDEKHLDSKCLDKLEQLAVVKVDATNRDAGLGAKVPDEGFHRVVELMLGSSPELIQVKCSIVLADRHQLSESNHGSYRLE